MPKGEPKKACPPPNGHPGSNPPATPPKTPPAPPSKPGPRGDDDNRTPRDPNALIGPAGFGAQGFLQPGGTWPYTVEFENDGTAAALDVTVTEQLSPNLDWSTFQLGSFNFGPQTVTVPAGLTQYQTTVAYQNSDGSSLNVLVALNFNVQTGLLTVTFSSLDLATGEAPTGVLDGFLPPDDSSHVGEGYVQYTVQPKAGLTTGAAVTQQASVVFDTNDPLATAPAVNTIDSGPPTSSVNPLPAVTNSASFTVSWSGQDDAGGSGLATFSVFVSDNGGPFTLFLQDTTQTSATFTGVVGHTYGFYSVATDNVGNVQPTPAAAQATTTVGTGSDTTPPTSMVVALPAFRPATFTVSWSGSDNPGGSGIASFDVFVSDNGGPFTPFVTGTVQTSATFTGVNGHTYGFYSVATDNAGNVQPTPAAAQATTRVDAAAPASTVKPLPAVTRTPAFTVSWSGQDDAGGSGLATFSVFVSDNGGPFTAFRTNTTATSAAFAGKPGHRYAFYSVATDNVGNVQPTPATTQATTQVVVSLPRTIVAVGTGAGTVGQVRVFDVAGHLKFTLTPYPGFRGGVRVATGDVNGDGVPDVITAPGPGGGPAVFVYDGTTGRKIRSFYAYDPKFSGGVFVAAGDVNGDGQADVVTGAGAGAGPDVSVFDGRTGARIHEFYAQAPNFRGGVPVAAGDVNGDGFADVIAGAAAGGSPAVLVFNGNSAAKQLPLLSSFFAYSRTFTGGVWVAAGDVNGDGRAEVITGAGPGGGPHVKAFDGVSGALVRQFYAFPTAFTGGVRVAAGDINGDGFADLVTGAGAGGPGASAPGPQVKVFDGHSLALLSGYAAFDPSFLGGIYVG